MTDYSELVRRLRAYPANRLCVQVADALEAQEKAIEAWEKDNEVLSMLFSAKVKESEAQAKKIAEKDARIAELEKENRRLRDLAYIAYQDGYKDAPPYSKYERSLDEIEIMWERSFAYAALKGEKTDGQT